MPSPFSGAALTLESVVQISLATIRVRFTNDPLAVNPAGAHDALNPANYTLVGPAPVTPTVASTVPGDPQAIDLSVSTPFTSGTWTLNASTNIQMASGTALTAPTALSFVALYTATASSVSQGARSDTAATVIRKHLHSYLKGPVWNALIAAFAAADEYNWDLARLAFDQLFKSSASGIYLDRRCSDDGVLRPASIGMPDDLYRKYATKITANKLTQEVMLEVLETFYGSDAVRAYAETALAAPYALHDGDELDLLLDEKAVVKVVFARADFALIGASGAVEVAAAITRACQRQRLNAFALAVTDPTTGTDKVRIYSASLGVASSVCITGGTAQPYLQFPTALSITNGQVTSLDNYDWTATVNSDGTTTFSLTEAAPCKINLSVVQTGDWVIVDATASGMPAGVYSVTDASYQYVGANVVQSFTVQGNALESLGVSTLVAQQNSNDAYRFFRPDKQTIYRDAQRSVVVSQSRSGIVDVLMPATTRAVGRTLGTAAYLRCPDPLTVTAMKRVGTTVTVTSADSVSVGDQMYVDEAWGDRSAPSIAVGAGATCNSSLATLWAPVLDEPIDTTIWGTVTLLDDDLGILRTGGFNGANTMDTAIRVHFTQIADGPNGERRFDYTWAPLASITANRALHAAVKLSEYTRKGHVLIVGGYDFDAASFRDSVEIYDPVADSWTTMTGALSTSRAWHEIALLGNNDILIVGGYDGVDALASTEIYTSSTDSMIAGPNMMIARGVHAQVVLADGRVLVTGGRQISGVTVDAVDDNDANGTITATCEIYDPDTNTFTQTGSMTYARFGHKLVLLADGRVLAVGGYGYIASHADSRIFIRDMEVFDPATGRWSPAGKLEVGRMSPVAALLPGCNKVVVGFGWNNVEYLQSSGSQYFDGNTLKPSRIPNPYTDIGAAGFPLLQRGVVFGEDLLFVYGGNPAPRPPEALLLVHGEDVVGNGGLNGVVRVATVGAGEFTYETPGYAGYTVDGGSVEITPFRAEATGVLGSYLLDPNAGVSMTGISSTTAQALEAGHQYLILNVADATVFPDEEGWICVGFGTQYSTPPVKYLGRYSPTALLLDYQFSWPQTIPSGTSVIWLSQRAPYVPSSPERTGFYLTASPAGRVAAVAGLESVVAAGLDLNIQITYPGDTGLGGAGLGVTGKKVSDKVAVWGGDDLDAELEEARNG